MSFLLELFVDFLRDGLTQLGVKAWKKRSRRGPTQLQKRKRQKAHRKKRYE